MRFLPGNAQHLGGRESQQDAFGFSDPEDRAHLAHAGFLAVLADGMGGMAAGARASRAVAGGFLAAYAEKRPDEAIDAALRRSLDCANRAVNELAAREGLSGRTGSTLVAAVLHDDGLNGGLHWISAGDSRIYLMRDGELLQLNADHTLGADLDRLASSGEISADAAQTDPQREALTSYLGGDEIAHVDANRERFSLRTGDRILLCSDGLYRALSADEIVAGMRGDPHADCERLVELTLAKARRGQDNVTVLAVACEDEAAARQPLQAAGARHSADARDRRRLLWLPMALGIFLLLIFTGWRACSSQAPQSAPQAAISASS